MHKIQKRLGLGFIMLGLVGIITSAAFYMSTPKKPSLSGDPKVITVNSAPSSTKLTPQTTASYTVPAANPRYIAIPALGISNTPVLKLGLLKSGAISTPSNIYEAGWYGASSLPGQSGAMFIFGHVSSWTAEGLFFNLKKLTPGGKVVITRGDNKQYIYQVVSTKIYPYNSVNMNEVLAPVNPALPGLNLMTCTGQVIKGTSEFNERLVVFTSLVSS